MADTVTTAYELCQKLWSRIYSPYGQDCEHQCWSNSAFTLSASRTTLSSLTIATSPQQRNFLWIMLITNLERDVVSQNLWAAWTWQPAVSQHPQRSNVHQQVELKIGVCWNTSWKACMKCSKEPGVVNSALTSCVLSRSQTLGLLTTEPLVTWQWVEQRTLFNSQDGSLILHSETRALQSRHFIFFLQLETRTQQHKIKVNYMLKLCLCLWQLPPVS